MYLKEKTVFEIFYKTLPFLCMPVWSNLNEWHPACDGYAIDDALGVSLIYVVKP